ncbi:unnamed protein product [Rotaria magnacalcarata]|uniref:Helix-turn-helix domain-containing protein n=1 Tax=Rotaria magnacalcarata TaxID=392030 RepID=A0A816PCM0_9BILA|nr:unnamed protein product [Rotaria magnacalcarata]CAF1520443.1 unnamed protein product [Rotaria magnacalcarata]CAF2046903.1 unnamed protein product [Rotaria magnacalcarata]CAF3756368.1 unnamed protein product [Rotaria magnacalcarata]CAF3809991.1 unnamed protein product [Rotaria magnacalcarata]
MATNSIHLTSDDPFDILDDDDEENVDLNEDLESILEEYNHDIDFDYTNANLDEEEMIIDKTNALDQIVEQRVLSQKFSQLLTDNEQDSTINNLKRSQSTLSTPDIVWKKIRNWDDRKIQHEDIIDYWEQLNDTFDHTMTHHILNTTTTTTISIEDLRDLAVLKNNIAKINLSKKLWIVYLKSGTGQWETRESKNTTVNRQIWSTVITSMIPSKLSTMSMMNQTKNEHKICEMIIEEHLQEFDEQLERYHADYIEKKNSLIGFSDQIENAIQTFVEQHSIVPLEMRLNSKLIVYECDYENRLLERKYVQLKPTDTQIQIQKHLSDLKDTHIKSKYDLIELKQRILCNKPTQMIHDKALTMVIPWTFESTQDNRIHQRQIDQGDKELQAKMTDLMVQSIIEAEHKIYENEELLNKEVQRVSVYNQATNEGLITKTMLDIINRRFNMIDKKYDSMLKFKINYYFRNHYDITTDTTILSNIRFSPTMIMASPSHLFTDEQLKLLNRGPTYVPPYQAYVITPPLDESSSSINTMIHQQYKLLQHDLSVLYAKHNVNTAQSMFISKEIKELYTTTFSIPLPSGLYQRALYEHNLIQTIQEQLKHYDLILRRTADQRNVFYLDDRSHFEQKSLEYMEKTNIFQLCEIIDKQNIQSKQEYLAKTINSLNQDFEMIIGDTKKFKDTLNRICGKIEQTDLPYLYFLPDISQRENNLLLQPVITTRKSATSRLASYLEQSLRPMIQAFISSNIFRNGTDFIRKLNQYFEDDNEKRLRPTTKFVTIKILNFPHMVSHDIMLNAFQDFLRDYIIVPDIENLSLGKIFRLTSVFLHNNRFYYNNKIYRFVKGGPMSLPFMETLTNMYLFQCFKTLAKTTILKNEFYGRYKDQIIFTWTGQLDELNSILKTIRAENINLKFDINIASNVRFLNAYIENQHGIIYSRVDHNSTIQPYTLPYVIGHSKVSYSHWFRLALIRAVRYCTSATDFNQERVYLEVTWLANGYSLEFIEKRINHFFTHFDVVSLRTCLDQQVYKKLRHRLFNFIFEQRRYLEKQRELDAKNQYVQLTYSYEFGPKRKFNRKIKEILLKNLQSSKTNQIEIKLSTKHQHSLNALLSKQKPSHTLI